MTTIKAILDEIDREIDRIDTLPELTDERYQETHDDFEDMSDQRSLILDWFERWADEALWPSHRRADVLSVGCGGGTMDVRIADVFSRHSDSLGLAGVDPNPLHTKAFADCFADRAAEVTVATCPFEQYETDHHFDVIHFLHCLYYFEELETPLRKAVQLLRPGGWMIVFIAPNESLNALAHRLWNKQWNRSAWYSDDVLAMMNTLGGTVRHEHINAWVDVSSCLDPQDERGRGILDFIVQTDTNHLTQKLQGLLRSYLEAISRADGSRRLAPHPVDAIALQLTK